MKQATETFRRIACNELIDLEGRLLTLYVVELRNGIPSAHYPLSEEIPNTEWMTGRVEIKKDGDGIVRAFYKGNLII